MKEVSVNNQMKLSQHFSLGELTKTKYVTADGNIPSRVAIENLIRVCGWLEELRARYNRLYVWNVEGGMWNEEPIVINSGYRSPEVNRLCGGYPVCGESADDTVCGDSAGYR